MWQDPGNKGGLRKFGTVARQFYEEQMDIAYAEGTITTSEERE